MQVLLLGGGRFIGRAIVSRLLSDGHRVTLSNRGHTPDPFGARVSRVVGERSDPRTLQRAISRRDFDVVIDCIAFREEDTQAAIDKLSGRIGHFIHISTASVYLIRDRLFCPFREEDFAGRLAPQTEPSNPQWLYAYHKRRCEQSLFSAWEQTQFPFTTLRLPMVIGPSDYTERSLAYLERLVDGGPLLLPDGGLNSWGFLWVNDIAETVAVNLANTNAFGRAYNLAGREVVSVRQFVETAASYLDLKPQIASVPSLWLAQMNVGTNFSPYTHDHDVLLDIRAAQQELLLEPTPFSSWCEQLVADFRANWNRQPSKLYVSRPLELRLVQELATLRVPAIVSPSR